MRTACHRRGQARDESGVALVEFALVFPLFMMLLLGMFSGGVAYNQKISITAAAREGARYAATLPKSQFTGATAPADWLNAVQSVVLDRAAGDLSVSGATICVSLVSGTGSPPTVDGNYSTTGNACYSDGSTDAARRVQVVVSRPGEIEILVANISVTLTSEATGKYEA